ncbi:sulfatase [Halomarina salina]|uniref:Sulfatase n=1 Tax=Halomarina salina TaxID=1872699 RepID=A0ABD5RII4_9EURY|nr:sulfatase [Halomarina salina]
MRSLPSRADVVDGVERRAGRVLGRALPVVEPLWRVAVDGTLVVGEQETPTWVTEPATATIVRHVRDDSRYYSVLDRDGPPRVRVESRTPFERVDCSLLNGKLARDVRVVGQFETSDGTETHVQRFADLDRERFDGEAEIPVSFRLDSPATAGLLTVESTTRRNRFATVATRAYDRLSERDFEPRRSVSLTHPSLGTDADGPLVLLVSVDTLRFDAREQCGALLDALGDDAFVPDEPRTQGFWTAPAHGSLFTGVHPGDHGYVGWLDENRDSQIHPDLVTLPEFLADHHYRCSAAVSHTRVLPESGFGRGFHRFRFDDMSDWVGRPVDAATTVDRVLDWMATDRRAGQDRAFYFVHLFDPHFPYLPPLDRYDVGDVEFGAIEAYHRTIAEVADDPDRGYLEQLRSDLPVSQETVKILQGYYAQAVDYTAEQVTRLVEGLKRLDRFDDALVIVTGDHGEEFGERGFYLHTSLGDANVRPFLAVKPPADSSLSPQDPVDHLDVLPTVARELGVDPPAQCQGRAWHDDPPSGPRVTERISPDCYNVAVEDERLKAIFTFEGDFPRRPTAEQVDAGPVAEEYYRLAEVRQHPHEVQQVSPSDAYRAELLAVAREFARSTPVVDRWEEERGASPTPSQETAARLRRLGYR